MDCRGMGPLVSRLDHLTASPFGGAARVVILDGTATDTGRVNWTSASLISPAGRSVTTTCTCPRRRRSCTSRSDTLR